MNYSYSGVLGHEDTEVVRKVYLINLFGLVGILFTFPLGIAAAFHQNMQLSFFLLLTTSLCLGNHFYLKKTLNIHFASNLILYSLFALIIYLVVTGGVNNTGPLWVYTFPAVALFLHGFKKGMYDIVVFLILLILIFISPNLFIVDYSYSNEFKLRIIYSLMAVTFLSSLHEYSRMKAFDKMQLLQRELELAAKRDVLTKLLNRRGIDEIIRYEYAKFKRNRLKFSIVLCDIDYFKKINDQYGHAIGDLVLKTISQSFVRLTREQDSVSRWGGEEFMLLLPETTIEDAFVLSEKIRCHIENETIETNNDKIKITMSFGLSEVNMSTSLEAAITQADNNLYKAKSLGRNMTIPAPSKSEEGNRG